MASEEVVPADGAPPPVSPPARRLRAVTVRKVLTRLGGARLVYGKPVKVGDRTVIPVARVFSAGGFGFGSGSETPASQGEGGGGGGVVDARPVGFIEIGNDGTRFEAIPDPDRPIRLMKTAIAFIAALGGTATGRRAAGATREALRGVRQRRGGRRLPSPRRSRRR